MADRAVLAGDEIARRLGKFRGWSVHEGKLHKEFRFTTFNDAFSFMTAIALSAESLNHHPEWSNVYNTVKIDLATHSAGGITERDFALLEKIETVAARYEH
jgi:4a-hydroxytetrahydrobiopterin dehydratase